MHIPNDAIAFSVSFLLWGKWTMSVLVISLLFATQATCISHKRAAAECWHDWETWSHLFTHSGFYLTDLEWLTLNSAMATIPMSPAEPNRANHWHKTPVFSLFLNNAPETGPWLSAILKAFFIPPRCLMPLVLAWTAFGKSKGHVDANWVVLLACHDDWVLSLRIRMRNAEGWGCLLGGWVSTRESSLSRSPDCLGASEG